MNVSLATSRLWWKESRQILPLLVAVPCLAIILALVISLIEFRFDPSGLLSLTLLPPILFSVGAGAVLVGQEKETRTLQWLSALPIARSRLVFAKLASALAGLAILWTLSILLLVLLRSKDPIVMSGQPVSNALILYLASNSLYLLLCGFATAWYIRSVFGSLLLILPLAALPALAAHGCVMTENVFRSPGYQTMDAPLWLSFLTLSISIAVSGSLAYQLGIRNLRGPRPPVDGPLSWKSVLKRSLHALTSWYAGDSLTHSTPPTGLGSLRWQFRNQNRGTILGLYAVFLVCLPFAWDQVFQFHLGRRPERYAESIATLIAFCTVCWMGVLTFQSDSIGHRIRFLAERGVTPAHVWISRHVAPLSFLAIIVILVLLTSASASPTSNRFEQRPPRWAIVVGLGIAYSLSQWTAQLFNRLPLAVVISPLVSYQAIVSANYFVEEWGTPILFIVVGLIVLPLMATRMMMRRWMDGRIGMDYQVRHTAMMALGLVLAYGTSSVPSLFEPRISDEVRRELLAEASRLESNQHPVIDVRLVILPRYEPVIEDATAPPPDVPEGEMRIGVPQADGESMDMMMEAVGADNADSPAMGMDMSMSGMESEMVPLEMGTTDTSGSDMSMSVEVPEQAPILDEDEWLEFQHQQLAAALEIGQPVRYAEVTRLIAVTIKIRMQLDDQDPLADRTQTVSQYRAWMSLMPKIVAGLRLSPDWISQEYADWLEIFLLAELDRRNTAQHLGPGVVAAIVGQVGDSDSRWQARRRAIILSWRAFSRGASTSLGGFSPLPGQGQATRQYERLSALRQADLLVTSLLEYIEAAKERQGQLPVQTLVDFWQINPETYGAPPGGPYFRIDDVSKFAVPPEFTPPVPASQWGAGWEQTGREWMRKIQGAH